MDKRVLFFQQPPPPPLPRNVNHHYILAGNLTSSTRTNVTSLKILQTLFLLFLSYLSFSDVASSLFVQFYPRPLHDLGFVYSNFHVKKVFKEWFSFSFLSQLCRQLPQRSPVHAPRHTCSNACTRSLRQRPSFSAYHKTLPSATNHRFDGSLILSYPPGVDNDLQFFHIVLKVSNLRDQKNVSNSLKNELQLSDLNYATCATRAS